MDGLKNGISRLALAACRFLQQNRHRTDMPTLLSDVRCWGQSGKHLLAASISPFDPNATSTRRGPSHPAYDGHFDLAPPPIPAGSGCVISSRIGMGISVAGPGAANASHKR